MLGPGSFRYIDGGEMEVRRPPMWVFKSLGKELQQAGMGSWFCDGAWHWATGT